MNKVLTFVFAIIFANSLYAKPINEQLATQTAVKFFHSSNTTLSNSPISLLWKESVQTDKTQAKVQGDDFAYYYVFSKGENGFVIISGDDAAKPVLGYSYDSKIDLNNLPENFKYWMEGYKKQIRFIMENNIQTTSAIQKEWNSILSGKVIENKILSSVVPLIKTKWDQSPYYNALCPYDYTEGKRTLTGCVATAMAQIMKFWEYPMSGSGFHSYRHDNYGTVSANFSDAYYEWDEMPISINSTNDAVANLMYHCGVAVEMDYGVEASGTNTLKVADALKTFFNYDISVEGISRVDYSDSDWKNLLVSELNNGKPIQYAGSGSKGGHSFVCDGYTGNYFHMNWGWGGNLDANFLLEALNPGTLRTYNSNQRAIIGIKPPAESISYKMEIYQDVVASSSTVSFGNAFSITTNIENVGTRDFSGDFCAAAFDENGAFVDYIEIKSAWSLAAGYHYTNGVTFSTEGLVSLLPGTYKIYCYYRPTGGSWLGIKAGKWDFFTDDYTTIKIVNNNVISLYSPINISTSDIITSGEPFSVNIDITNTYIETFTGSISVSLYSLDGSFVKNVALKTGISLEKNYHYTNGLDFTNDNLDVEPGTYLLAVQHQWDGYSWELTGSTDAYKNPIKIIVQAAPFQADKYEYNDDLSNAYQFNPSFSGNSAYVNTNGSNIHKSTDFDYYKVDLPSGSNYTIDVKLQDEFSHTNGIEYSLDGLFSYSLDGINWSETFDSELEDAISSSGGKTVYFWVAPYFSGFTGTYQLDINISKTNTSALTLSTNSLTIGATANSTNTFNINSNIAWSASSDQPWLTLNNYSGNGNSSIQLTATANPNKSQRSAYVTVSGNGVPSQSIFVTQDAATTSITTIYDENIQIFPNPASDMLTIDCSKYKTIIQEINIYDILGNCIVKYSNNISNQFVIDLEAFSSGTYTVVINDISAKMITHKLVVNK